MPDDLQSLEREIGACRLCTDRFAATATHHAPRPVFWLRQGVSILIAGQAPGMQVHLKGRPFDDRSGDRLRDWMGIDRDAFYDRNQIAVLPMAFCFPGYNARGADLPPPPICAKTWRLPVMQTLGTPPLILLVGHHAQKWHLGKGPGSLTETVAQWRGLGGGIFPLPHPSWRNTGWLKKNPWFAADLLPELKARVAMVLAQREAGEDDQT